MMNDPVLSPAPNSKETRWGCVWLVVSTFLVPLVVGIVSALLAHPLSDGMFNVVCFVLNVAVTVWLFRDFLKKSLETALERVFLTIWYAILAYLAYQVFTDFVTRLILIIDPTFGNVNDEAFVEMMQRDMVPLGLSTVLLVPVTEETLFRGLIWRKLYDKNPVLAYIVSMLLFAAVHVIGYIGTYPPLRLALCFVQYLPAGFCLCWCYKRSGTIISPMLMHAIVNAAAIFAITR
jgi:membrane protease YdiL (CAAX protease family)